MSGSGYLGEAFSVCCSDGKHPGCDASIMGRREFSFTLEHDIYMRYLSFHDVSEMEATIKSKCPHKIDIGALYNVEVRFFDSSLF